MVEAGTGQRQVVAGREGVDGARHLRVDEGGDALEGPDHQAGWKTALEVLPVPFQPLPRQPAAGPVGHHSGYQEGRVLGTDLFTESHVQGAGEQGRVGGVRQSEQVAHLRLRCRSRAVLRQHGGPRFRASGGNHHVGDRSQQVGSQS